MTKDTKHIVITGATRGIGRALASRFVALGHRVSGCGRNLELISKLTEAHGKERCQWDALDVTDHLAVDRWAMHCLARFGPPDLLINNAAIVNRNAPFVKVPREEFDTLIDINIKGVANTMRAFLPSMIERNSGVIINLSSGWGRSTSAEVAPYCASKFAIEGLTKAIAQELPRGMAAIPLSPNTVNTSMLQSCFGVEIAGQSHDPDIWADTVAPWLLKLGPRQNGQSLSTPL